MIKVEDAGSTSVWDLKDIPIVYKSMSKKHFWGVITACLIWIFYWCCIAPYHAHADEFFVDGGLGAFDTEGRSIAMVKFAKFGVQEDLLGPLKQRFNVGLWLDQRGQGYSNAAYGGYQLGFDVKNSVLEMGIFSGPTLISSTDAELGGLFQLNETFFFGIRDSENDFIGAVYNHFSSAGLEMPNLGKDFIGLEIRFPF